MFVSGCWLLFVIANEVKQSSTDYTVLYTKKTTTFLITKDRFPAMMTGQAVPRDDALFIFIAGETKQSYTICTPAYSKETTTFIIIGDSFVPRCDVHFLLIQFPHSKLPSQLNRYHKHKA